MGKSLQMRKKHLAGSGGGAKSRTPIEAADSIQTISFARFMDIISEGPCVGFADGLKSYFCDDTPIENADASRNFKNVLVDVRLGELDQDYVEGLTAAENEIAVGVEVKTTQPWTRNISNTTLDSVRVRLGWPGGLKKIQDNQDTTATIVEYAVDLAVDGGPFVEVFRSLVNEKASSQFERSHRIGLPAATIGWLLRVRRITPDSTSQLVTDKMAVNGFTEIIEAKLTYPGTAYVVTQIDGSQFQSVPQRAFDWIGRIVRVPSNYNAVARTYTGIWDGTFTLAYTNNPAWCAFDLVTHRRYGLGKRVDPSVIEQDKWTFYEIARYCDEMVPDGFGGLEPRFTMNILLQDRAEAYRVLSDMFGSFNSMLFWGAGGVRISQDKPAPVDYVYTRANVSPEGFQYTGTSRTARHNAVLVAWNDQADMSRQKVEYVEDAADIAKHGLNQIEIQAFGCTSRGQAIRKARAQLLNDLMLDDAVSFTVGLDKLKCVPGSIIEISDPKRMGQRMGGRIASATDTVITIDRMPPQAPVAGDILTCILPSGKPQKRTIDAVSGRSLSVSVPFDAAPLAEAVWQLERATLVAQQYRVMSITPKDDSKATGGMKFEISAVKHEPSKYAAIDYGRDLDPLPTFSKYVPAAPEGLSTSSRVIVEHGSSQTVVTLSWDPVPGAAKYIIEYRFNGGNWVRIENIVGSSYDIYGAPPGDVEWRIQAVSAAAQPSPPLLPVRGSIPENDTPPIAVVDAQSDASQALEDAAAAMNHSLQEVRDREAAIIAESNARAQEILAASNAAKEDAQAKANAARDAAIQSAAQSASTLYTTEARANALQAQINDVVGTADDWANDKAYPKGDSVCDNGTLYRAKVNVPAGTPTSNTTYWENIGNYSSVGEAVAAAVSMSSTASSWVNAYGSQTQGVIARIPSGTGQLATEAWSLQTAQAQVSPTSAVGQFMQTVGARLPSGNGTLSTEANVLTQISAEVSPAGATGQKIDGVIARMPSGNGQLSTEAFATQQANAVVSPTSAVGQFMTSVNARLPSGNGTLSTEANVLQKIAAEVSPTGATGSKLDGVVARMPTGSGALATAQSVDTVTARVDRVAKGFSETFGWSFNGNSKGFSVEGGSLEQFPATSNGGALVLFATTTDPNIQTPAFDVSGSSANVVRAKLRFRGGAIIDPFIFWVTPNHWFVGEYAAAGEVVETLAGGWHIVEWDLTGNTDWNSSLITRLRFDLTSTNGGLVDVEWIALGKYGEGAGADSMRSTVERVSSISARMPIGIGAVASEARVDAVEQAAADSTKAVADRVQVVEARLPVGTDKLASEAFAIQKADAAVSPTSAVGQFMTNVGARLPAGNGTLSTEANVLSQISAEVSPTGATGKRLGVVEARMPTGTDKLANEARVVTAETAAADALGVQAGRIDSVVARMPAGNGAVADASIVNQAVVDIQGLKNTQSNPIQNPSGELGVQGWINGGFVPSFYVDANAQGTFFRIDGINSTAVRYTEWVLPFNQAAGTVFAFAVDGQVVARTAGSFLIDIIALDAGGNVLGDSGGTPLALDTWGRAVNKYAVPANTRKLWGRIVAEGGAGATSIVWKNAQFAQLNSINDAMPAYNTGGTIAANVSQLNALNLFIGGVNGSIVNEQSLSWKLGRMLAKWTMLLDVNGNISGVVSENDGQRSTFSILSTVFRVISSTTGLGMEWLDGYLRMWKGSAQLIIGHTFGANQDMIFYYGPNVGAANASKSNASVWFDTTGNAYFGGSLSAGTRKNAAQSTQQSATASVETGNFGTGGNAKVVVVSFGAGGTTTQTGNTSGSTLNMSANVVLERSYAGGAWTQIGSFTASGEYTKTFISGDNITEHRASCGGSITVTDNQAGAGTFNYRARITSSSNIPVTLPNGAYQQSLSVISTEQ